MNNKKKSLPYIRSKNNRKLKKKKIPKSIALFLAYIKYIGGKSLQKILLAPGVGSGVVTTFIMSFFLATKEKITISISG